MVVTPETFKDVVVDDVETKLPILDDVETKLPILYAVSYTHLTLPTT